MEMTHLSSSKNGSVNNVSNCPHDNAKKIFNQYITRVDADNSNPQIQNQIAELQSILRQIKTKQKKKVEKLEHQIDKEQIEIQKLTKRLQSVVKSKEKPTTEDTYRFASKYILFCTSERRELSQYFKSAEKPCFILKECYSYCERKHKISKEKMMKEHLISTQKSDIDCLENLQKRFAAETSKCLLQELKDEKPTNEPIWKIYEELLNSLRDNQIDGFFEKALEICWIMVSEYTPMKFCFDRHIRTDIPPTVDIKTVVNSKTQQKSSVKSKKSVKKQHTENDNFELKYPAVVQGTSVIVKGLQQEKLL